MKQYTIFGIGNALVDLEFTVTDEFLQKNNLNKGQMTLMEYDQYERFFAILTKQFNQQKCTGGGSAANSTVIFSQLGGTSHYNCRVAKDDLGEFYAQDLIAQGVHCQPSLSDSTTGKCIVLITPDAERTMLTYLGATKDLSIEDIHFEYLENAEWLFIEGYLTTTTNSFHVAKQAIIRAKQVGVKISISFSDPTIVSFFRSQITELLELGIDLLFTNEEEILTWSKQNSVLSACQKTQNHAKKIVVTLGEKGCAVYTDDKLQFFAGVDTEIVDTNGAGDAFAGAFLYATSQRFNDRSAARLSNSIASAMISQFGARLPKTQTMSILKRFLNP